MKAKPSVGTGVLMLGAAILGPATTRVVPPAVEKQPVTTVLLQLTPKTAEKPKNPEGPWQASCRYWGLSWDGSCVPRSWKEVPSAKMASDRLVTALIATVPDPVHSSQSLEFDRTIDVLAQAAQDNGYVMSYYWLPWRRPTEKTRKDKSTTQEAAEQHDEEQEQEPGLLILKPAKPTCDLQTGSGRIENCPNHALYVFLVGQTPALGVNRPQLARALEYEDELRKAGRANLSLRHPDDEVDVIGPNSSGAAASLHAGLAAGAPKGISIISIAGNTSTVDATDVLNTSVTISRTTSAKSERLGPEKDHTLDFCYVSFSDDSQNEQRILNDLFGGDPRKKHSDVVFLTESGTTFGSSLKAPAFKKPSAHEKNFRCRHTEAQGSAEEAAQTETAIHFPREISILRNAQKEQHASPANPDEAAIEDADPYLHLSLKDGDVEDTIPHFSREVLPYAEESEWMAVVRELEQRQTETVAISASNILDTMFLAQSLHRDLPDVRPLFFASSDLLFARSGDAGPYIGSIAVTAYPMIRLTPTLGGTSGPAGRSEPANEQDNLNNFGSYWAEAFYNAVSFTLWNPRLEPPTLAGYSVRGNELRPPPLWITTIGRDGYYPLAIADLCSSAHAAILPEFARPTLSSEYGDIERCSETDSAQQETRQTIEVELAARPPHPGVLWFAISGLILVLCSGHIVTLKTAEFWSPSTHDLAIAYADQPRRRAVYIHIATAMLFGLSAITSIPVFCLAPYTPGSLLSVAFASLTLLSGVLAVVVTLHQTRRYLSRPASPGKGRLTRCLQAGENSAEEALCADHKEQETSAERRNRLRQGKREAKERLRDMYRFFVAETDLYPFFNLLALSAALLIPSVWFALCTNSFDDISNPPRTLLAGTFFSYRCLYPASGVSPLIPVCLILVAWCLWAFFQTHRLRFSENSRPILPPAIDSPGLNSSLYVSDEALSDCDSSVAPCLYRNVTCLLITHRVLWQIASGKRHLFNIAFIAGYVVFFAGFVLRLPIHGLDHYLRAYIPYLTLTPYELLIATLFYPLLVIALSGALRMVLIWTSTLR